MKRGNVKANFVCMALGAAWLSLVVPANGEATKPVEAELPVLTNAYLKIKFTPGGEHEARIYDAKSKQALVTRQFLEMPEPVLAATGKVDIVGGKVPESVGRAEEADRVGVMLVQDWPLFEVSKEVVLKKDDPELLVKYTLKSKQNCDFRKPYIISSYFIAGDDIDRIGWRTPVGMEWAPRGVQVMKQLMGTDAVGAGFGRFAAFQQGTNGPALILAAPCKAQRPAFNIWHYYFPPGPNQTCPSVVGFKSGVLVLEGPVAKGDLFVIEWRGRLAAAGELDKAADSLLAGYRTERAQIAATKCRAAIPILTAAPVIDGKLDDQAWSKASSLSGFILPQGGFPANGTEAKLLSANGKLYLGVTCRDNDIANIKAKYKEHDGNLWEDDSIEIFLAPPDGTKYFQFILNSLGAKFEQKCDNWGAGQVSMDKSWDMDWNVKTALDPSNGLWIAEVELPLAAMGVKPEINGSLRLNLNRNCHCESGSCWAPTYGGFHDISRFGAGFFSMQGAGLGIDDFKETPEFLCRLTLANPSDTKRKMELHTSAVDNDTQDGSDYIETILIGPGEAKVFDLKFKNLLMERVKNKLMIMVSEAGRTISSRELPLTGVLGNKRLAGRAYPSAGGTVFWALFPDNKVFKTDEFVKDGSEEPLMLDAAKGEQESFQLVIASPTSGSYKLESSVLESGTNYIPVKNVKMYRQRFVTTKTVSDSYSFLGDWPDPLQEENTLVAEPGANIPAWITVRVPREAAAGIYHGKITVMENGKTVAQIPYDVKVRKFALPPRFSQEFPVPDPGIFRNEYNMDTAGGFGFMSTPELEDGKIVIPEYSAANKQAFDEKIAYIKKYNPRHFGMCMGHLGSGPQPFDFLGTKPGTPEYYARRREHFNLIYNKFKEYGLEKKLKYYIYDEPTPAQVPLIQEVARIVSSISPDIFIWGAIYFWKDMDAESRNLIDGWFTPPGSMTPEFLKWARENHKTPMPAIVLPSYPEPSFYIDAPILSPRVLSWINWKIGADVITTWHSYYSVSSDDPYSNPATFSRYNGDGMLIWPSGAAPYSVFTPGIWTITSIRIEMLRDGMEDYEYLKMLSDLIKAEKNPEFKRQAEKVMTEAEALVQDAKTYDRNAADYRLMKAKLADMIEKLTSPTP